jgi:hypothetical protein
VKAAMIIASLSLLFFSTNALSLTLTQKQLIYAGNYCCYSEETINGVLLEQYKDMPKHLTHPKLDLDFTFERADNVQWTIFFTLQLLDVYTTKEALKFDCVEELNPLLGKRPSTEEIIFLKLILLGPALYSQWRDIQNNDLYAPNFIMAHVIANNYDVLSEAKNNCNRIR